MSTQQQALEPASLVRFAELDPDVVWPGPSSSAGDAIAAALDKVREREHVVLDRVVDAQAHVTRARELAADAERRPTVERVRAIRVEAIAAGRTLTSALVHGKRLGVGAVLTAQHGDVDEHGDIVDEVPRYDDRELARQRAVAAALAARVGCNLSTVEAEVVVDALLQYAADSGRPRRAALARDVIGRLRPRIARARAAAREVRS